MIFTIRAMIVSATSGVALWAAAGCADDSVEVLTPLTIYSPTPPTIMLHEHNMELGAVLESCGIDNAVTPMPLPDSINAIAAMDPEQKPFHLPIITTVDFLPAIHGGGPEWHRYAHKNEDLKFVTSLYDVAFGMLALNSDIASPEDLRGKRVGAPPRPSSVRMYTEALLRDGWGIIEDVDIVDVGPADLMDAVAAGRIDATTWSLMSRTAEGFRPLIPQLLKLEGVRWIEVDDAVVEKINDTADFRIGLTQVQGPTPGDSIPSRDKSVALLSFKQGLAAWEATPAETVRSILSCVEQAGSTANALPENASEMVQWPMLPEAVVHDGARDFYRARP